HLPTRRQQEHSAFFRRVFCLVPHAHLPTRRGHPRTPANPGGCEAVDEGCKRVSFSKLYLGFPLENGYFAHHVDFSVSFSKLYLAPPNFLLTGSFTQSKDRPCPHTSRTSPSSPAATGEGH